MNVVFTKRSLTRDEIGILVQELHDYPHIGWISESGWKRFPEMYVATLQNKLVGVCVINQLKQWVKIGPLVIIRAYQGKGYGKMLLQFVLTRLKNRNIYIGSSNPIVGKLASEAGFYEGKGYYRLPMEIKLYLVSYFFQRLNPIFLLDAIRKIFMKKRGYSYFLKLATRERQRTKTCSYKL